MTSLDNLQELEKRLRALLSDREDLKTRLSKLEKAKPGKRNEGASEELWRVNDLLIQERKYVRKEVEALLSVISHMSKAS